MDQLSYCRYQLKYDFLGNHKQHSLSYHEGILLKQTLNTYTSFVDIHPWPELGDPDLEQIIQALRNKDWSFALLMRAQEILLSSWSEFSCSLENHYLLQDLNYFDSEWVKQKNFQSVKVKMGLNLTHETQQLKKIMKHNIFKWRLDFNEYFQNSTEFTNWLDNLSNDEKNKIEFIEDPLKYNPKLWSQLQSTYNIDLAVDRAVFSLEAQPMAANVIVIKPNLVNYKKLDLKDKKIVVTHGMDHPLGQLQAAYEAELIKQEGFNLQACGLLPVKQDMTQIEPFSYLQSESNIIKGSFRFPQVLLEELSWLKL